MTSCNSSLHPEHKLDPEHIFICYWWFSQVPGALACQSSDYCVVEPAQSASRAYVQVYPPHHEQVTDSAKMPGESTSDDQSKLSKVSIPEKPAITFNAPECKVDNVVVYLDRAEVCRSVVTDVTAGENEIIVRKLSEWIDKDSIRVEGRGKATITEVSFQSTWINTSEQENENVKLLRSEIESLKNKEKVLNTKLKRLEKQRNLLDGFADKLIKQGPGPENNDVKEIAFSKSTMDGMVEFFSVYDRQASKLDEGIHDLNLEIKSLASDLQVAEKNLKVLNASQSTKQEAREVSILLDASEDGEVELLLSYVVSKAKWSPKYDIRVFSNENKMKIQYYGLIQQATGEDWEDAKLSLTTAMPSIGGTVPDLGTQKCFFKPKMRNHYTNNKFASLQRKAKIARRSWTFGAHDRKLKKSTSHSSDEADTKVDAKADATLVKYAETGDYQEKPEQVEEAANEVSAPEKEDEKDKEVKEEAAIEEIKDLKEEDEVLVEPGVEVAPQVKDSITSTSYEVSRNTTILCDNKSHKVSVALLDFSPTFEYQSVPKKSAHAYLKAKVKNTSQYALLAGPTNIFLDNNFVAKAELKAVSPSEEFTCSLGVDPGVRVNYKPLHKYREQSGVITKTVSTIYRQDLEIKNTHEDSIRISVIDQLPLSMEEKIKINLLEPSLKHSSKQDKPGYTVRLNKQNNLEWELEIPAGESKELTMKFCIDHPVVEEIDFLVAQENLV